MGVRGEKMVFVDPKENENPVPEGCGIREIVDGTSNTIMLVEASDSAAVEWTRPADYEPNEAQPLSGLVGLRAGGFLGTLVDGRTHFIPADIDPTMLMRLFIKNDGQPVKLD